MPPKTRRKQQVQAVPFDNLGTVRPVPARIPTTTDQITRRVMEQDITGEQIANVLVQLRVTGISQVAVIEIVDRMVPSRQNAELSSKR